VALASRCLHCARGDRAGRALWEKACTAYVIVRVVRVLQAYGRLPGHGGLRVGGTHVHHAAYGAALVVAQHVVASRRGACRHTPWRANVLCTGVALLVDEFDLPLDADNDRRVGHLRTLLDAACVLGALAWGWRRLERRRVDRRRGEHHEDGTLPVSAPR
jgi:hypothetical protein